MSEKRLGIQRPTQELTLPYKNTDGEEAIKIYNKTGRTAQKWQKLLVFNILGKNEEALWTHIKYGYSIPRGNGKNEVMAMSRG